MVLTQNAQNYTPHPEGIHPAVCVDVIDLGLETVEFQGESKTVPKIRLVFETEARNQDGTVATASKKFTASLHPKAKLADFVGKWRGKAVEPNESIDLSKLIGACCTLVISHQKGLTGNTYASIDAVSKPTKKIQPSGTYDAQAARQRIADYKAKQGSPAQPERTPLPPKSAAVKTPPSSGAGLVREVDIDPEVGF